jgi:Zn finger protein HypA/HybF involved in hydrogenase expression
MPETECRCNACDHTFAYVSFKGDDILPVCPRCKARDIQLKTGQEGFMAGTGLGSLLADIPKGPS